MGMNINGIGNLNNPSTSSTEKTEQTPEEIVLFASNSPEAPEANGKIRRTVLENYKGNIAGKDFSLRRRKNLMERGYQIIGNIGNQQVDIEERNKLVSMSNKKNFKGKIGENPIEMQSSEALVSATNKKTYTGKYKGKTFTIEYSNEHAVLHDGDKVMKGTYGGKQVDLKYDYRTFSLSDGIDENQLPEGFEDVAALIMTIDSDQTVRRNAENARRQAEAASQTQTNK